MNFGFDLDKIFIDYPPFIPSFVIDRLYKRKSKFLSYRIPSKIEQYIRIISHHPILRPPIFKNLKFIENLNKKPNNKIFLISSRFGFLKNRTNNLIEKHKFNELFDNLYFNFENKQPHIFKNEIIQKIKVKKYVDDDLELLFYLSKNNPKTKFFWFNKKEKGTMKKNLIAINELFEILK